LKNYNEQFDALDILNVASFLLGYENLLENRSQSAQNDVNAANDKQAKLLLDEIGKRLDNQDSALERIERLLHDKLQE
jgi:hypothetical protein